MNTQVISGYKTSVDWWWYRILLFNSIQYIGIITIYHHPWIRISVLGMFLSFLSSNILDVDGQNHSQAVFYSGATSDIRHQDWLFLILEARWAMWADGFRCDMMGYDLWNLNVHAWVMLDASMYNKSWYVMICPCYNIHVCIYMYIIYVNVCIEDEPDMIQMGNGVMMWWFWVIITGVYLELLHPTLLGWPRAFNRGCIYHQTPGSQSYKRSSQLGVWNPKGIYLHFFHPKCTPKQ
jgi:hypothetical protein